MKSWSRPKEWPSQHWFGPLLIAAVATGLVLAATDPAGDYPNAFQGPGLTVDEIFNVDLGVRLADRLLSTDIGGAIEVGQTLPDHPPLARLWLGLWHEAFLLFAPPSHQHFPLIVAAARGGSAIAFGILVWLVGFSASKWFGKLAGSAAAVSLVFMPRVFGHAHLASLETVLNLTYTAAIISVGWSWSGERAPTIRTAALCGLWLGLALLTKIQAIFIPVPIAIWAIVNWRHRALLPLFVWGFFGLLVFLCGWPWMWLDPWGNLLKYLGHATERTSILVWYFGQALPDKAVPWHYPWLLFATTVPLGLHALGLLGAWTRVPTETAETQPLKFNLGVKWLLLGSVLFPLLVFSVPGIAVYDGERLFLVIYPLWALLIGRGVSVLAKSLATHMPVPRVTALLTLFLALHAWGLWQYAPCWLSYYNVAVGGLSGAEKLGLQTTYWGDGVTRELWLETTKVVPSETTVDIVPILHPFQIPAYYTQCLALRQRKLKLQAYDSAAPAEYLLLFTRRDYLPKTWNPEPPGYKRLAVVERQGVVLAGLYQRLANEQ